MAAEFDHLFICASSGGEEEASSLTAFGLTEGPPNVHPGQGTACRRFFFANVYLELLWVCDAAEAQAETARPTRLWERWINRAAGACPFGLGFRPRIGQESAVPFSSWEYRPPYLPAPLCIHVATNVHVLVESMLFYLPFAQRSNAYPTARRQPFWHRAGLNELTRVEVASPHADRVSSELAAVTGSGLAKRRAGSEYLLELGFDGESGCQQADFQPILPLRLCW